ncbi:class I SAM-dependent DNA methyltransferase [Marivita geojedonensis]|uniref:Methyltransferase type 11 n=1 Tax=Marivita geojedonensis TaxID=1123756 RepID=A0A1X4NNP1_9RHOB|nr:methyltransferase domain-containing protein [Marivita geojedonensis]OSQ52141.1 methyltransferase type 11 [Marivita geojedonensis]PRY81076.1 methyltransferase family protein [Marivita geojedonensis]
MSKSYLDKVYDVKGAEETRALYDAWSESYEAEIAENGYATPKRCAEALSAALPDKDAPILDFGCGTGLSGIALRQAGFTCIDGVDLSPDMLAKAKDKSLYRSLTVIDAGDPPPGDAGTYTAITAIGVIGSGAAPLSVLDQLCAALVPGGLVCFSFNDHTLEDPAFENRVTALVADGTLRMINRDYGPHLPARNINSAVYVLEKT